ncbi:MAG: glycosyltransferase [Oscillospiraceae bacterium]|nr:glycosyltransferase [Oscillospiraceae bacterium]
MSEELSVCLINDSFPPLIDGVANTVKNYAAIINKNHGKATVAVPYYPGADDSDFSYKVVRFPSINTEKLVGYRAGYPFDPETLEEIKTEKINIIHTHCPFMSTLLARTLREPLDAPVVFTYHTKFDIDIEAAVKNRYIQKKVLKHLVSNIESCDEVWVVSEGAGENLRSIGYTGEYVVMPNGVDMPKGRVPEEKIEEATAGFDLPKEIPVFLFVGRMAWYKGVGIAIEALADIKNRGDDFRMVFIGGGRNFEEIKKYSEKCGIADKCIFTGPIQDRETLRAWYCRADLFLFPSVYDTNGLVVREAAACGLGSLLIEKSCAAEGITDGETGFICKNTPEDFADKLHSLCTERELMKTVGKNAMDKIYVSWEDSVAAAVERYKIVLEKYRSGEYEREQSFSDEWFAAEGELLDGINRSRNMRHRLKNAVYLYGKEKNRKMKNSAKNFYQGINEKRKKAVSSFREKLDKYL